MATTAVSAVGQDQFLQLLIAQLQNQDPLNPLTDQQFISQLTSLNTVQGIQSLNANFAQMLQLQQLTQGASLIGKTVEYTPTGRETTATGVVSALTAQDGTFVLTVGNDRIGLDQITVVRA